MAQKCFMCGAAIAQGILCEKCDKPRKRAGEHHAAAAPPPSPQPVNSAATAPAALPEEFPKAPLLQFPVESASPAITSVANVLIAGGVPGIVIGPDRSVKFVTDEAKRLFGAAQADLATLRQIEMLAGTHIGELAVPASVALKINDRNILFSLVPISGGASGAVLVFREAEPMAASHTSFVTFVRETVFAPLRSLRESMRAATGSPLFADAAATIDQILSSLEMAPEVKDEPATRLPKVTEVLQNVADRFRAFGELKGIAVQVDAPDLEERFGNAEQLREALGTLMDNSMHYVPPGGQVVI